jgi:hypothetical protein
MAVAVAGEIDDEMRRHQAKGALIEGEASLGRPGIL